MINWAEDDKACYELSLTLIEKAARYLEEHDQGAAAFGGARVTALADQAREELLVDLLPHLRGLISRDNRFIATVQHDRDILQFVSSVDAARLAELGTSCPDHFLRTKIKPLYVDWDPGAEDAAALLAKLEAGIARYRDDYADYYQACQAADSPPLRDPNPTVILIPSLGMIAFGKNKSESRVTAEFYTCAVAVMRGAESLGAYVALPRQEAFDIEYWSLEEAKLRRMPPEKPLARKVVIVIGAGSGIGAGRRPARRQRGRSCRLRRSRRECRPCHSRGAYADPRAGHRRGWQRAIQLWARHRAAGRYHQPREPGRFAAAGGHRLWRHRRHHRHGRRLLHARSTGAAIQQPNGGASFDVNARGGYLVAEAARGIWEAQGLPCALVLTTSVNAAVAKAGSIAYDISKAAANHLVRELAIELAPQIRVNGLAPATVVAGSSMFPRQRVINSLIKYQLDCGEDEDTETLRERLANFYAQRTLTKRAIRPEDQAEMAYLLISEAFSKTTGQIISVDGGLHEAFLR